MKSQNTAPMEAPKSSTQTQLSKLEIRQRIRSNFDRLRDFGLLPTDQRDYQWKSSNPSIELHNPLSSEGMREFIDSEDLFAFAYGSTGTGKTYMARCCVTQVLMMMRTPIYLTASSYFRLMRNPYTQSERSWINGATLFVIDDLDKFRADERDIMNLHETIDLRRDRKLKTILTTNVAPEGLSEYLLGRAQDNQELVSPLMDRLQPIRVLHFEGKSHRSRNNGHATQPTSVQEIIEAGKGDK